MQMLIILTLIYAFPEWDLKISMIEDYGMLHVHLIVKMHFKRLVSKYQNM